MTTAMVSEEEIKAALAAFNEAEFPIDFFARTYLKVLLDAERGLVSLADVSDVNDASPSTKSAVMELLHRSGCVIYDEDEYMQRVTDLGRAVYPHLVSPWDNL